MRTAANREGEKKKSWGKRPTKKKKVTSRREALTDIFGVSKPPGMLSKNLCQVEGLESCRRQDIKMHSQGLLAMSDIGPGIIASSYFARYLFLHESNHCLHFCGVASKRRVCGILIVINI